MTPRAIKSLRWLLPAALIAGCRADMTAWRAQLATPPVARLDGAWTIVLRADSAAYRPASIPAPTAGVLALVLNHARVTTGWFSAPPVAFGTYDIGLDSLNVAAAEAADIPDLWVFAREDSVLITLSPRAKWPVTLAGAWHGDSIAGRWQADQRAGPNEAGNFVMRRR